MEKRNKIKIKNFKIGTVINKIEGKFSALSPVLREVKINFPSRLTLWR